MRLSVLILDSDTKRARNIQERIRVWSQSGGVPAETTTISDAKSWASQGGVKGWFQEAADVPDSRVLVLAHHSDIRTIGGQLAERIGEDLRCRLMSIYAGYRLSEDDENDLRYSTEPPSQWFRICMVPGSGEAPETAGKGTDHPPVEQCLEQLTTGDANQHADSQTPDLALVGREEEVRHNLVNAIGPLWMLIHQTRSSGQVPRELEDAWESARERLGRISDLLPIHIRDELQIIDQTMPHDVGESDATDWIDLVRLSLARIGNYAHSLSRGSLDVDAVLAAINKARGEQTARVLWIEDEPEWYAATKGILQRAGIDLHFSQDPRDWLKRPDAIAEFDCVLLDIILVGCGPAIAAELKERGLDPTTPITDETAGIGLLYLFGSLHACPPIFVLSARSSVSAIQACIELGAHGFFTKDRYDVAEWLTAIFLAKRERDEFKAEIGQERAGVFVGNCIRMQETMRQVIAVAPVDRNVLILGETGTGKELVARALHNSSPRAGRPFVKINCGAIPESLFVSNLLGHERGAYTGANSDTLSKFEHAQGGSVFLDEIGELSVPSQAALLQVTEEGAFTKLGGNRTVRFDVRILAATNRDVDAMVQKGRFREDLSHRFPLKIFLPPLRERSAAHIIGLAEMYLDRAAREFRLPRARLSSEACKEILSRRWKGNVRELVNSLESALIKLQIEGANDFVILRRHLKQQGGRETRTVALEKALEGAAEKLADLVEFHQPLDPNNLLKQLHREVYRAIISRYSAEEIFKLTGVKHDPTWKQRVSALGLSRRSK